MLTRTGAIHMGFDSFYQMDQIPTGSVDVQMKAVEEEMQMICKFGS